MGGCMKDVDGLEHGVVGWKSHGKSVLQKEGDGSEQGHACRSHVKWPVSAILVFLAQENHQAASEVIGVADEENQSNRTPKRRGGRRQEVWRTSLKGIGI